MVSQIVELIRQSYSSSYTTATTSAPGKRIYNENEERSIKTDCSVNFMIYEKFIEIQFFL